MLSELIADTFMRIGHTWKIGSKDMVPQEEEVEIVLDEAAKKLYDGAYGDRLEVGGIIVEKREGGHDVYCYIGSFE